MIRTGKIPEDKLRNERNSQINALIREHQEYLGRLRNTAAQNPDPTLDQLIQETEHLIEELETYLYSDLPRSRFGMMRAKSTSRVHNDKILELYNKKLSTLQKQLKQAILDGDSDRINELNNTIAMFSRALQNQIHGTSHDIPLNAILDQLRIHNYAFGMMRAKSSRYARNDGILRNLYDELSTKQIELKQARLNKDSDRIKRIKHRIAMVSQFLQDETHQISHDIPLNRIVTPRTHNAFGMMRAKSTTKNFNRPFYGTERTLIEGLKMTLNNLESLLQEPNTPDEKRQIKESIFNVKKRIHNLEHDIPTESREVSMNGYGMSSRQGRVKKSLLRQMAVSSVRRKVGSRTRKVGSRTRKVVKRAPKVLRKKAGKLGLKLTVKRGKSRVPKSAKVLAKQVKKATARKTKVKRVYTKRRATGRKIIGIKRYRMSGLQKNSMRRRMYRPITFAEARRAFERFYKAKSMLRRKAIDLKYRSPVVRDARYLSKRGVAKYDFPGVDLGHRVHPVHLAALRRRPAVRKPKVARKVKRTTAGKRKVRRTAGGKRKVSRKVKKTAGGKRKVRRTAVKRKTTKSGLARMFRTQKRAVRPTMMEFGFAW